jgi:hypothetical protein
MEMAGVGWRFDQTAGPSTAPLAMKLQEASLRMTLFIKTNYFIKSITEAYGQAGTS